VYDVHHGIPPQPVLRPGAAIKQYVFSTPHVDTHGSATPGTREALTFAHRNDDEVAMPTPPAHIRSTVIPSLRYRDAPAAIEWLCKAFGFEKHAVHADGEVVHHAELVFGSGMVMLGSVANASAWGERIVQPDEIGGRETQCPCVVVADCAAHYARAKSAGAVIVDEFEEKEYGGAGYSCRDPEGHLWWFGSYDPWSAGTS
jgi:uncharacterized glyoxalase superfamily protein PhnB